MKYFLAEAIMASPLPVSPEDMEKIYLPAHVEHISSGIASGMLLFAGPKAAGGGLMIARAESREAFRAFLDRDPYTRFALASFRVEEFRMNDRSDFVKNF